MATATIEITLPGLTGFTLTLDLYPLGSDTAAVSGLSLTEATNRKCTYTTTTSAGLSGAYLAVAKEGSTVRGEGYVGMTDTANVHVVGIDLPGKVLGGGAGTISGVGARVEGFAGNGARSVTITVNDGSTALQSVTVRVSQGAESYVQTTNASGVATFTLNDATWTVRAAKPGYSMSSQSLVVDGTEAVTYSMTAVNLPTPASPTLSVGYVYCYDKNGIAESGVKVKAEMYSGDGTTGRAFTNEEFYFVSDATGLASHSGFVQGGVYYVRCRNGSRVSVTVPAASSFALPEIIGRTV